MWNAAAEQQSTNVLYIAQGVTLLVALVSGWFALRGQKTKVVDDRQARFEARLDRALDEAEQERDAAEAARDAARDARDAALRRALRYELALIRLGIDPSRIGEDGGITHEPPPT